MAEPANCIFPQQSLLEKVSVIGQQLRQRGWYMSCAESCTGGGLSYVLTSVAGSSDWFQHSVVTYSNQAKQQHVAVPTACLATHGAVSAATVEAMVAGLQQHWNAQVAVAISGIAGPGGGSTAKPVGLVWFGFGVHTHSWSQAMHFDGDRLAVREQAITFAVEQVFTALNAL